MKTALGLLLMLFLVACEPDSIMDRSGETLDDASDDIRDAIDDATENAEEDIEEAAN